MTAAASRRRPPSNRSELRPKRLFGDRPCRSSSPSSSNPSNTDSSSISSEVGVLWDVEGDEEWVWLAVGVLAGVDGGEGAAALVGGAPVVDEEGVVAVGGEGL